jgi:hypothetical protein
MSDPITVRFRDRLDEDDKPLREAAGLPRVWTRERWSDAWTEDTDVWPEVATWSCGPTVATAQLRRIYGRVSRGGQDWQSEGRDPWTLPRYVKIEFPCDDDTSRTWYGRIEIGSEQLEGTSVVRTGIAAGGLPLTEQVQSGQLVYMAYGLEQMLARHQIRDARFDRNAGTEKTEDRIAFNARGKRNRGNADHSGTYVFYYDPRDTTNCSYWSTRDIVKYLLRWQTPRDSLNARQVVFECAADDLDKLPDWDSPSIEQDGATTLSLIHRLISRQRLFTHWWEVNGDTVRLRVETLAPNDVNLSAAPGAKIPAASRQVLYLFDLDRATSANLKDSGLQVYDVVVATGAPEVSVGTFSWQDNTLKAGWTVAQEHEYEYGASLMGGYASASLAEKQKRNVAARAAAEFDDVYSRFVIKPSWDQRVANGLGGASSPLFVGDDGPIPVYFPECFVMQGLPFYPGVSYGSDRIEKQQVVEDEPADELERRPVLCLFRRPVADADGKQRWLRTEEIGRLAKLEGIDPEDAERITVHCSVPAQSHGVVFKISGHAQHAIAATEFAPLDEDERAPQWDFATGCLVTLALQNGRLTSARFPAADPPGVDTVRVLEIDAGGRYERIYVAPQTVVDVDRDGQLVRSTGGWIERPANCRAILRDIARVAAAWYSIPHKVVEVETSRMLATSELALSDLVVTVGDETIPQNDQFVTVNATVSEIRLTWPTSEGDGPPSVPTLSIATFAGELDALAVGPADFQGNPFKRRRVIKL